MYNMFARKLYCEAVLNEADDDEQGENNQNNNTDANQVESNTDATNGDNTTGDDDSINNAEDDTDFDIDTSLDDTGDSGDDSLGGDSDDSSSSSSLDSGGGSGTDSNEEPIQANTDIFTTLTAEEQIVKITELKRLFNDLYTSTSDILIKINQCDNDNIDNEVLSRITSSIYELRRNIGDYILYTFGTKSFVENDIMYNRFLTILNTISSILTEITPKISDKK